MTAIKSISLRKKACAKKSKKIKPDAVINAAGYNAVDKCESDEIEFELAKKINGYGPGMLAKICKEKEIPIVHYVSDYIFDGEKGEYTETDKPNPISELWPVKTAWGRRNQKKYGQILSHSHFKTVWKAWKITNVQKKFF